MNECKEKTDDCHKTRAICTDLTPFWKCHCKTGYSGDGKTCEGQCLVSSKYTVCWFKQVSVSIGGTVNSEVLKICYRDFDLTKSVFSNFSFVGNGLLW